MRIRALATVAILLLAGTTAAPARGANGDEEAGLGLGSFLWRTAMYFPNRVLDLLDPIRARVRVGPGTALNARATQVAAVHIGGYTAVFAGLHGPRGKPRIPWPAGLEQNVGIQVGLADVTPDHPDARFTPHYGPAEIGAGVQLLIVGFDVGVEPLEILDFAAGLMFFDLRGDDF